MTMVRGLRVLSIYEGFFAGGARVLHSNVLSGLHEEGRHVHSVLSIHREMHRETLRQRMEDDSCFRLLRAAGVRVTSLGRIFDGRGESAPFSAPELTRAASRARRADIVLSLKEQPLRLANHPEFPRRPTIVCLHRSDPENQGSALGDLRAAVADGRVVSVVCCAESTRAAYQAAGIPGGILQVIPNGVDLTRFQPVPEGERALIRRSLGIRQDAPVIVFAARYDGMKNVPLLLRSAAAYLRAQPTGHVLMCGPGMRSVNTELVVDIQAIFAGEPELRRRLHLLGVRHDMETVYAAADVVTLTSSVGEAAPLCLIEGMMCGAIPVATDVGDCASIVAGHGLITAAEPDAISAAWTEAVARRPELVGALDASRTRFSRTRMTSSYATLIERIAREASTAPALSRPRSRLVTAGRQRRSDSLRILFSLAAARPELASRQPKLHQPIPTLRTAED